MSGIVPLHRPMADEKWAFPLGMTSETHRPKRPVPLTLAARWCGVRSSWLRSEAKAGRLPGFQAGDRWLFDLAQLEEALAQRVREEGREQ